MENVKEIADKFFEEAEKLNVSYDSREAFVEGYKLAKETEKKEKHASIDKQVSILKDTLEEMMTGFDSEENRMDFILDICNGYKKRINF